MLQNRLVPRLNMARLNPKFMKYFHVGSKSLRSTFVALNARKPKLQIALNAPVSPSHEGASRTL